MAHALRNRRWYRYLSHFCRVVFALTFLVSGFYKAIDPWGTILAMRNYLVAYDITAPDWLVTTLSIWLSCAELMMGCMLLFKVRIRMASVFAVLSMIFFTVLTFLSATIIPVEDCGCFGELVKLTPWQSFAKNAVLLPMALCFWYRYRPDRIFAFSKLEFSLMCFFFTFAMSMGTYHYLHLPLIDMLPYKVGVNIAEEMDKARANQSAEEVVLLYRNIRTGRIREFSLDDKAWHNDKRWEWVETRVESDNNSVEPMILEFYISDEQGEVTDSLLSIKGNLYILCVTNRNKISHKCEQRLRSVVERAAEEQAPVICLTPEPITRPTYHSFADSKQVRCYNIDSKTLKTMLRANTGLVVLTDGIISRKSNCTDI